jgi:hypothetical protein
MAFQSTKGILDPHVFFEQASELERQCQCQPPLRRRLTPKPLDGAETEEHLVHGWRTTKVVLALALIAGVPAASAQTILQFLEFVQASPFNDGANWFLTEPLTYQVKGTTVEVSVPCGFVTDFASIPRPFWSLLPTWGKYGPPAVVHDFLYWDQQCTREQADRILLLAMEENDVGPIRRFIIHRAVRWGGAFAWSANAELRKRQMERTIPDKFWPTDPKTEWAALQAQIHASEHQPEPRPSPGPVPPYCGAADAAWNALQAAR